MSPVVHTFEHVEILFRCTGCTNHQLEAGLQIYAQILQSRSEALISLPVGYHPVPFTYQYFWDG